MFHSPEVYLWSLPNASVPIQPVIPERFVKFANGEIVSGGAGGRESADVCNIRETIRFFAIMKARNETHPPSMTAPRNSMTCRENQIPANENTGTGPKRTIGVMICADPDLADSAMRPHVKALVDVTVEDVSLDRRIRV